MRIGDLNKRIEWQAPTKVADGMGGYTHTYTAVCTVWAAIWPVSAKEQIQADQTAMTITHRIRMRYRRTLKSSWRGKYAGRCFSVVGIINPNESNEMLELLCMENKG